MSFQQALSGLFGASAALDTISNNVANSGTVGFKQGQTHFADIYASALGVSGKGQIGTGVSMAAVAQGFSAGSITATNNPLDLAINGQGFFQLDNGNYTRNGQFHVDSTGYIVNDQNNRLMGYNISATTGQPITSPTSLQISTAQINGGQAKATTSSAIAVNLDSRQAQPTAMTATTVLQDNLPASSTPASTVTLPAGYSLTLTAGTTSSTFSVTIDSADMGMADGDTVSLSTLFSGLQTAVTAAFRNNSQGVPTPVLTQDGSTGAITIASGARGAQTTLTASEGASLLYTAAPTPTAGADNFDPTRTSSYNSSTSETIYDSQGTAHVLTTYFCKGAVPGQWTAHFTSDGTLVDPTAAGVLVNFDANGNITPGSAIPPSLTITPAPNPLTPTAGPSGASVMTVALDFTGTTQFGSSFAVNQMTQDGYQPGTLTGVTVASNGMIQGKYSNGQTVNIAQVALSSFPNPNGLQSVGGNQWAPTAAAGAVSTNIPGASNLGVLQAGSVEESNVDLTKELVDMITQQRAYQANAQSIKTQDQIMQTLVNLR